jgi:hypothetical protein
VRTLDPLSAPPRRPGGTCRLMSADLFTAFDHWLADQGNTLAVPVRVIERDLDMITLKLAGISDAIEIIVVRNEIMVVVTHDGGVWDTLMWIDCKPRVGAGGVYCRRCEPAFRSAFPTHQALFSDHLFQPLAEWIKAKLMPMVSIGLGDSNGSRWATLLPADDHRGYSLVIPLRAATAAA